MGSFLEQGAHRFDWQEHDAFAERRKQKAVPSIEADGVVIDRMSDNPASAGDFRSGETSSQRVGKHFGPETDTVKSTINGQPPDEQ